MKELKEIRFDGSTLRLEDNLVRSPILPMKTDELNRDIIIVKDTVVEGAIYAHKLEINTGNVEVKGAVFTQLELYIHSMAQGTIKFNKSVGSSNSIVTRASNCRPIFASDINAKTVTLYNAFVAGCIYADDITLENSVVIGGVFATQQLEMSNSIVGTFNAPFVHASGINYLLLPSAFSVEPLSTNPGTKLYNLSLADLGALFRRMPQSPESGRIEISINTDEIKSTLVDEESQRTLHCYTVVGKVLAADLIDTDKFQNHFLLTSAALGPQLLKSYDFGTNADGTPLSLSLENIRDFFFEILSGKKEIRTMDGSFDLSQMGG